MARVTNYFDHAVSAVDGPIRLKLRRMTVGQFEAFNARFRVMSSDRKVEGAPEAAAGDPADQQVADDIAHLERNAAWVVDTFRKYVKVVPGDLVHEHDDGSEEVVTDGARFAELYAAEASGVLAELWLQNKLTDSQKKILLSAHASANGSSSAASLAAPGPTPATAAPAVAVEASASTVDATAPSSDGSSGTTDRFDSEPVQSAP